MYLRGVTKPKTSTGNGKSKKPAKVAEPTKAAKAVKPTKPTRSTKAVKAAESTRKDPEDYVHIGITPPDLADDTEAQRLDGRLASAETRPGPVALSMLPWLKQNVAYRAGYHLMTHGLKEHADHPEIEVCNVPGVLVRPAAALLNEIADYVLNSGRKIRPGETMSLTPQDDPFLGVLSFRRIRPGKGGMDHDQDVLRLLFLR